MQAIYEAPAPASIIGVFQQGADIHRVIRVCEQHDDDAADEIHQLNRLNFSIGENILGRTVRVTELELPENKDEFERPIAKYNEADDFGGLFPGFSTGPQRLFRGRMYAPPFIGSHYKRKARGKVVDADINSGFLVVKPLVFPDDRFWIRVLDATQQVPLVNIDFLGKPKDT